MRPPRLSAWPPRLGRLGDVALAFALHLAPIALSGCFGSITEPSRTFFAPALKPPSASGQPPRPGLVRVRDLDLASTYDRLQLVVRRSPIEVAFRSRDLWVMKPNRMVSELLARALAHRGTFEAVSHELSERRPSYLMGGELHALEVLEGPAGWSAHLALDLHVIQVETGRTIWTYSFDAEAPVADKDAHLAVAAFAGLLERVVDEGLGTLGGPLSLPQDKG